MTKDEYSLEIWKTVIGVQKHFNELELRIRNFAILTLAAVLSGVGLTLRFKTELPLFQNQIPAASMLLFIGGLIWLAFWYMDRHWYHRLLIASVIHAMDIEKELGKKHPEITLSTTIKNESPNKFLGRSIRSTHRLDFFYFFISGLLFLTAVFIVNSYLGVVFLLVWVFFLLLYFFLSTKPHTEKVT